MRRLIPYYDWLYWLYTPISLSCGDILHTWLLTHCPTSPITTTPSSTLHLLWDYVDHRCRIRCHLGHPEESSLCHFVMWLIARSWLWDTFVWSPDIEKCFKNPSELFRRNHPSRSRGSSQLGKKITALLIRSGFQNNDLVAFDNACSSNFIPW